MKILGICGSPREGASEFLLKRALEELESEDSFETIFISVRDKDIVWKQRGNVQFMMIWMKSMMPLGKLTA